MIRICTTFGLVFLCTKESFCVYMKELFGSVEFNVERQIKEEDHAVVDSICTTYE